LVIITFHCKSGRDPKALDSFLLIALFHAPQIPIHSLSPPFDPAVHQVAQTFFCLDAQFEFLVVEATTPTSLAVGGVFLVGTVVGDESHHTN